MRAMVLKAVGQPLQLEDRPDPVCGPGRVLLRVHACGVCRTDLHVVDGDLTEARLPLIPGHQIVGTVLEIGDGVTDLACGDRVGVPWLAGCCGECRFCRDGRENLCEQAAYTGYQIDGGFAQKCTADVRFCFRIPAGFPALQAAPLLCAGLIGYRSYRLALESCGWDITGADGLATSNRRSLRLGFYGFGAAAHILIQVARFHGHPVYAFTRPEDEKGQAFARKLGAVWAGPSDAVPPERLDAAILFAPAGELVPASLRAVDRGGVVVCAGIHMSDIPTFPYRLLWQERMIRSVANLTRRDGDEFLSLAPAVPIRTRVHPYPLEQANQALDDLRAGRFEGAAVVEVDREGG